MGTRVALSPAVLAWVIDRSRVPSWKLEEQFPTMGAWGTGENSPTLKQAEESHRLPNTPFGVLLLAVPPVESIPLPKPAGSGSRSYVACWELRSCVRFIVVGRSRVRGARVAPLGEHGSPEPGSGGGMGGDSRVVRPAEPLDTPSS